MIVDVIWSGEAWSTRTVGVRNLPGEADGKRDAVAGQLERRLY